MPNRLLNIKDGHNFRDLGGYQAADGRTTKWRQLLRTGSLATLSDDDLATLAQIPVTQDIDLRGQAEVQQMPDRVQPTTTCPCLPRTRRTPPTATRRSPSGCKKSVTATAIC